MSSQESASNSVKSYNEHDSALDRPVSRVKTCGDGEEFVIIGGHKYYRHELMQAFGGTMDVGLHPAPVNQIANPSPLGLVAFSITTLVLSLYGLNVKGIEVNNVIISLCIFWAGTMQFLAGIWECVVGNTFACTAMVSYGAFFLSFGVSYVPSFGVMKAYMTQDPTQLGNAIGFYLIGWSIFTFMLFLCTLKSVISLQALFFCIFFTFLFQGIGYMTGKHSLIKVGCGFGLGVTFFGLFNAWAGIANSTNTYFSIPHKWLVDGSAKKKK
ncbi:Ammonia transport outward protein 2 [Candida viswanathii]|uniref:Ammonia transport outward protein 2 n=1 Tax=Candida viswanathii TaxID=5486 RepID=A0A367YK68_9ASCO|nr:Ammonia transport outward protein 2 [Candida viswanathii]